MSRSRYYLACAFAAALIGGCGSSTGSYSPSIAALDSAQPEAHLAYNVLHSFGGAGDGSNPAASLIVVNGALDGTTMYAAYGECHFQQCGTAFSLTTSGAETMLSTFCCSQGSMPKSRLLNVNGTIYGTNYQGGFLFTLGTVFEIIAPNYEKTLYEFTGHYSSGGWLLGGAYPAAGLIYINGLFYGTTHAGGAFGSGGTLFELTPSGLEYVLHSFGGHKDGSHPQSDLLSIDGTLYGTTVAGGVYKGGTIFSVALGGPERVLHAFGGQSDGANPEAGVIDVNGTLYGTTYAGGTYGKGTVFSIPLGGAEKVLHSFGDDSDGANPVSELIYAHNAFYGTTSAGGRHGKGTIFRLTLNGKDTVLHSFGRGSDGATPLAGLVAIGGTAYGTTYAGGANGYGTVFSFALHR